MDQERLYDALRKADAAGDTESAKKLSDYIRSQAPQAPKSAAPEAPAAEPVKPARPDVSMGNILAPAMNYSGKDAVAGAVRGAGSIGATLVAPYDYGMDYIKGDRGKNLSSLITGKELPSRNAERRAAMDGGLREFGANPDSTQFKTNKFLTEFAGVSGVGSLLSKGAQFFGAAPSIVNGLRTGGFDVAGRSGLPGLAARTATGAASGAATAGLVNPEDFNTGAMIGGGLPGGVKVAGMAGNLLRQGAAGLAKNTLGLASGVGGEAVGTAYQAGKTGGTKFLDNMRGNVPFTDVLDDAKSALSKMRVDRGTQYRQGMAGVSADKTVIDFKPIETAVNSLKSMGNYKGQVINKNASGAVDEISDLVNQWKGLDPKEFHTPEGLDALKQAIGDMRDATQFGTPARKAADTAYNAVKAEITTQAPTYAKVMKDYSEASETLAEIERALSLGNKAAADTSMRKLQSLMRNNVNTNYGNRLDLAKVLESKGAEILPAVAGQQMSSLTPRGLQAATASIGGAGALALNPAALALLPMTSPRLIGEAAYGLGAMNRGVSKAVQSSVRNGAGLLAGPGGQSITMDQLRPLLSAAPILAAGQR